MSPRIKSAHLSSDSNFTQFSREIPHAIFRGGSLRMAPGVQGSTFKRDRIKPADAPPRLLTSARARARARASRRINRLIGAKLCAYPSCRTFIAAFYKPAAPPCAGTTVNHGVRRRAACCTRKHFIVDLVVEFRSPSRSNCAVIADCYKVTVAFNSSRRENYGAMLFFLALP